MYTHRYMTFLKLKQLNRQVHCSSEEIGSQSNSMCITRIHQVVSAAALAEHKQQLALHYLVLNSSNV